MTDTPTGPISSAAVKVRAGLLESLEQLDKSEAGLVETTLMLERRWDKPDYGSNPWVVHSGADFMPILPTLALKLAEVRLARVNVLTALAHLEH